jgi:Mrp family chromosome partitioning ATPase
VSRFFEALQKRVLVPEFETIASGERESKPATAPADEVFGSLQPNMRSDCRAVFHSDPQGIAAEQYRLLRRRLVAQFPLGAALLITSPAPGDGKTSNAINLAWCLAENKRPTLLLEVDLRRPSMAALLGCCPVRGVEAALSGEAEPEEVVGKLLRAFPLYAALVSNGHKSPAGLFSEAAVKRFLGWAKKQFDWVIMDAPPALPMADVSELRVHADATLLVVRERRTPRELIAKALEALGDHVRGVILNEASASFDPYYRYYGEYYGKDRDTK